MARPDWLTVRPVAHRGLHDAALGIVENTASAFTAAIAGNYGIECDLQLSADGEAMVHHDDALGRLTEGQGRLDQISASDLKSIRFRDTADRMMTLGELCDLVAGRATLVIELKSRFDGDRRLASRTAAILAAYRGPVAVMSFDPDPIAYLRTSAPPLVRGIVAERHCRHHDWDQLSVVRKRALACLAHAHHTRPQFIAYSVRDLPAVVPWLARTLAGLPLLTWTVRTPEERAKADRLADQMIFEGFRP